MLEAVWAEVELPDPNAGDWWDGLAALARSTRRVFLVHPAAASIAATRPGGGRNILCVIDVILACRAQKL
jgi:Tetracyclin repressor-like, C-terminal domain